ncbi:MAG: histidinol-phosphatase [Bacteroidales bacterium]|jgi:predicted ATPase|nr:histidinol-phosphatase [Bacteroidales bacterium]
MENESKNIFENGATWLRADFHLHTKADKEFLYTGNENDFCKLYVEKLKEQNIYVGVITNHNKFDKNEFVALKKKASKKNIELFAGVEFSLKEGIHILIVFDDKWYQGDIDDINKFLENAFYGIANYDKPKYPNSNFNLKETVEALDRIGHDYFIVLAHIDDANGLFTELRGRTQEDFVKQESFNRVLAVQKSANLENYQKLCKWLKRKSKIACVEGSDNAHGGIDGIGKGKRTYVKLGDFNFEALIFALTDSEYRVSPKVKPEIKNSYIKSISFEGGLLDGTRIDFSPELNTLIGIRGSGKSSVLEILRYTLGLPLSPIAVDPRYKDGLIENVLRSGGKSIVTIVNKQKEEYRIEKIYGQKEDIYKGDGLQPDISINAIFDYPVYFGQKDLSNKDADFEADLVQRLIGTRLKDIQSKIEQKKRGVTNIITEIKKLDNLNELKKETETIIKNAEHQLQFFKEKGVEDKLKQQTLFDSDVSKLSQSESSVRSYLNELQSLIFNHDYFFQQEISGSEVNQEFFEEAKNLLKELKSEFEKLKTIQNNSVQVQGKYKELIEKINVKKEGLKEEFAKIKREIGTDIINPDNFLTLNRQIDTSKLKLLEIDKSENRRKEWQNDLSKKLTDLDKLWHEEYQLLQKEVSRINEAESKLSITIEFKGRKDKLYEKLKQIFGGRGGIGIYDNTYKDISENFKDFIQIFKDSSKLNAILNENQVVDFKRRFSENLEDLLTFKVDNKIVIQYNGKSLDKHSLGQRASALILFLLAQKENDILIIDQPEDDLDNQTIYDEVIKELKKLKGNMQFVFATHNANIPVLGDSEKVIACNYDEKKMTIHSGSIDNHQTQRFIVDIMEGGDEAFNRRKNIYSIWNIEKIISI